MEFRTRKDGRHYPLGTGMSLDSFVSVQNQDAARVAGLKSKDTHHIEKAPTFRQASADSLRGDTLNSFIEAAKTHSLDSFAKSEERSGHTPSNHIILTNGLHVRPMRKSEIDKMQAYLKSRGYTGSSKKLQGVYTLDSDYYGERQKPVIVIEEIYTRRAPDRYYMSAKFPDESTSGIDDLNELKSIL